VLAVLPLGPEIDTTGAVVSRVKCSLSAEPVLPARSVAVTVNE
jgi:hypothetical protein